MKKILTKSGQCLYDLVLNEEWTKKLNNELKYYDFNKELRGLFNGEVVCENNIAEVFEEGSE